MTTAPATEPRSPGHNGLTPGGGRAPGLGRLLWGAWKAYGQRASGYQGQVLLSLIYFLILGPSALGARLFGKRLLDLDTQPRASYWVPRPPAEKTLTAMERQF